MNTSAPPPLQAERDAAKKDREERKANAVFLPGMKSEKKAHKHHKEHAVSKDDLDPESFGKATVRLTQYRGGVAEEAP